MHDHAHHAQRGTSRLSWLMWLSIAMGAAATGLLIWHSLQHHGPAHEPHTPPLWGLGILPFIAILGAIAFLPLIPATAHWWESNRHRFLVSLICAGLTLLYVAATMGIGEIVPVLEHAIVAEYIPFIVLLFCLYVISGGIRLTGDLLARPAVNTAFLAVGAILASFIGTTGASMLLIRPLLHTNSERKHVVHTVVFFIFLVSNIGGSLLPIGDPPLFLGYLKGVPFLWTLGLFGEWLVCTAILLGIYYWVDRRAYAKEDMAARQRDVFERKPLRVQGWHNAIWLSGVVLAVAFLVPGKPILGFTVFPFMRELVMLAFVAAAWLTTNSTIRTENRFNFHAITEVAALFVGIFIAMQIPVMVLNVKGPALGLSDPWHFYWLTGALSSFLDNAPTYVVFFETANAMTHEPGPGIIPLTSGHYIREDLLVGISLGAVFMGAMTYIGNGPNFMVKSIAEQSGVRMPTFFGYMFKYSLVFLLPVFLLITLLFLIPGLSPLASG